MFLFGHGAGYSRKLRFLANYSSGDLSAITDFSLSASNFSSGFYEKGSILDKMRAAEKAPMGI